MTIRDSVVLADLEQFANQFPGRFDDPEYLERERNYKLKAHQHFIELLSRNELLDLIRRGEWRDIAQRAKRVEGTSYNLLHSSEKIAFRDALFVAGTHQERFARMLYDLIWGGGELATHFTAYADAVEALPKQGKARVFTWPVVTVLPFLAQPDRHCLVKPSITKAAVERYGIEIGYRPEPNAETYTRWLGFANALLERLRAHGARDLIDVQSFLWVIEKYPAFSA